MTAWLLVAAVVAACVVVWMAFAIKVGVWIEARAKAYPEGFDSQEAFYAADERRRLSPEVDFGVWWRGPAASVFRLTWVEETGEVIAVSLAPATFAFNDGSVLVRAGEPGAVFRLAVLESREAVEQALAGWAYVCGEPDSLGWARGRLARRAVA